MANNQNKFLTALMEDGADAFDNMFDVYITYPGADGQQVMTVRAQGFTLPSADIETYQVKYKGTQYTKPKPSMNFERTFTLTFRLDAAYNLLSTFKAWQAMVVNPVTGGVSNVAAALGSVTVEALAQNYIADQSADAIGMSTWNKNSNGTVSGPVRKWIFDSVWVRKVSQPTYNTEGGDAIKFDVEFVFSEYNDSDFGDASTDASSN